MEYFIDTEFIEKPGSIELISIGIVSNDGRELYAVSKDFNILNAFEDDWIRENVLKPIYQDFNRDKNTEFDLYSLVNIIYEHGKSNKEIAAEILDFIPQGTKPVFYGCCSAYDWVLFCQLFGSMIDLPKSFPIYCKDLKQMIDQKADEINENRIDKNSPLVTHKSIKENNPNYPKQTNEHNALADAYWNKKLYEFLVKIRP